MRQKLLLIGLFIATAASAAPTFVERVEALKASKWIEPCDKRNHKKILEMARALDLHQAEIEWFLQTPSNPEASTDFKVLARPKPASTPRGWQKASRSWSGIYSEYFAPTKVMATGSDWALLGTHFRSLLYDDESRLLRGTNYGLAPHSKTDLELIRSMLKECLNDSTCVEPPFSLEFRTLITINPFYRRFVVKPMPVKKFLEAIEAGLSRYDFIPESTVRKTRTAELELPIDPGPLAFATTEITEAVERFWKRSSIRIKIIWSPGVKDIYKIGLLNSGEREHVDREKKRIWLTSQISDDVIAHELGHVLGFQDRYFDYWNSQNCSYEMSYDQQDLMSCTSTGDVLSSHGIELEKQYPLTH